MTRRLGRDPPLVLARPFDPFQHRFDYYDQKAYARADGVQNG